MSEQPSPADIAGVRDLEHDVLGPAPSVDDVVAALRDDPVLVHPSFGNGARDAVDTALTAKVESATADGVPVYVALVPDVTGLAVNDDYGQDGAQDLAVRLADRLGDGVFFTAVDPHSLYPQDLATGSWQEDYQYLSSLPGQGDDEGRTALVGEVAWGVDQVTGDTDEPGQYLAGVWRKPTWDFDSADASDAAFSAGFTPAFGFVVVAVLTTLVVRTVALWRDTAPATPRAASAGRRPRPVPASSPRTAAPVAPRQPVAPPSRDHLRARARHELERVGALREERAGVELDADLRTRVDGSLSVAESLLDDRRSDAADLIGAHVLAQIAGAALERRPFLYRPCFFNPTHGRAQGQRRLEDSGLRVPACAACARRGEPDVLHVGRGRRVRAYFERGDVWARTGFGALSDDLWSEVARARSAGEGGGRR